LFWVFVIGVLRLCIFCATYCYSSEAQVVCINCIN